MTRSTFSRSFLAGSVLTAICLLVIACSPASPKLVEKSKAKLEKVKDSRDTRVVFAPQVDILLVIANDSSMEAQAARLRANASQFTSEIFKNKFVDYHIGVINAMATDQRLGPVWGGRLNGNPKWVERSTPDPQLTLEKNMLLGSRANDPVALFTVVQQAFTAPISNSWNQGFLRPAADLAIMFISDTDPEDTPIDTDRFYSFLLNLKGRDPKRVSIYAAYDPSPNQSCGGEGLPVNLNRLLSLSKGFSFGFSLCDPDFGKKMAAISYNIVASIGTSMLLNRVPDPKTIEVRYGTQVIPNDPVKGWTYDPERNALVFGTGIELTPQPTGTETQVNFIAAQYD